MERGRSEVLSEQKSSHAIRLSGAVAVLLTFHLTMMSFMVAQAAATHEPNVESARDTFLQQDIDALLDKRYERIAPFLDWTYGWTTSYTTSYISAAYVIAALWQTTDGWLETSKRVMRERELRFLRQHVMQPEQDAARVSSLIKRHIDARLFAHEAEFRAKLCPNDDQGDCPVQVLDRLEDAAVTVRSSMMSPQSVAEESKELMRLLDIAGEPDVDFVHAMRPLTSRILIFILRFAEITSIIMLVRAGLRKLYLPNTAATRIFATLCVAWGLDYCVLQLERSLNEDALGQRLTAELAAQRPGIDAYVNDRIAAAEKAFFQALPEALEGAKPWP